MADHGGNEDRLSFANPPQGPSFDNLGDLVTALKLQFLQGVPPTPENINRAQQRAEQVVSQNPDAGAQSNVPGGTGDVAGVPSPATSPLNAPIPPVNPQSVTPTQVTPINDPAGGNALTEEGGGFSLGSGIDPITALLGGATGGVAGVGTARFLADRARPSFEGLSASGIPDQTLQITDGRIRPPNAPQLGGPEATRLLPSGGLAAQNTTPGEAAIRAPGPDTVSPLQLTGNIEAVDTSQSPIGPGETGNERVRPNTAGEPPPTDAQTARATQVAEAAVPPGTVPTPDEIRNALPATPNRDQLLNTFQERIFGSVIGIENLDENQRVQLMQMIAVANDAAGEANTRAGLTQGAGLGDNRAGSIAVQPGQSITPVAPAPSAQASPQASLSDLKTEITGGQTNNQRLQAEFLEQAKRAASKGLKGIR